MADKKKKKEKPSPADAGKDAPALILEYLHQQNRPYSAIDISANLHNKVTKGAAAKALKDLHQQRQIEARVSGKQTVYHALQDCRTVSPDALAALQANTARLQTELAVLKDKEKQARDELAALQTRPLLAELRRDVDRLEHERESLLARLGELGADDDGDDGDGPVDRAAVESQWRVWRNHASVRRRICRDLWLRCSEVVPEGMTAEELWESLGLEGACLG
ncbi:TBPIP-domain-containing protein [Aspergillus ambiguus]|uniref:putative TBP interacting domain protein n=1 Tax=Aspergillus ambiguus TaxID=176160 RepID=UPI003CCD7B04